jgi:folate-binding protein YgfZ
MVPTSTMPEISTPETPLAAALAASGAALELKMHRGAQTPLRFTGNQREMRALVEGAGIFDLGFRTLLRATGKDRVRWLNGMITQAVKGVAAGQTETTLVLNPQGRIQGDADLFVHDDALFLETDRSQAERLLSHLRRYIIMDDVKLEELDASATAMGIAGPHAVGVLEQLGGQVPQPGTFRASQLAGIDVTLVGAYSPLVPRFEIQLAADRVAELWHALAAAGAAQCGLAATEDLRVLEGTPQFAVDFSDANLPQETNLFRTLNFSKGCYIGQEIVERIRARARVHKTLRQFELRGSVPPIASGEKIELRSGGAAVGELTSLAAVDCPGVPRIVALGIARIEALEKSETEPLVYDGGTAVPLAVPVKIDRP